MSRIAYIFFGQVKNFDEKQYEAFKENVDNKLRDHDVDYFLTTSRSTKYSSPRQQETEGQQVSIDPKSIQAYFDFKNVFYDDKSRETEDISGLAKKLVAFGDAWDSHSLTSTKNSLKQLYGLQYFWHNFKSIAKNYDVFILSRCDLFHTHAFDINCLNKSVDLLTPYYDEFKEIDYGQFGGLNDRFAVAKNVLSLAVYCSRYSSIKNNPQYYHAEEYLKQHINQHKLSTGKIHNFCFLLYRANCKISDLVGIGNDKQMNTNLNKVGKSYFINLDRRLDRLNHIYKDNPFFTQRISAADAKKIKLNDEVKKLFPKTWGSRSKAEICCAISHYRLWQKLANEKSAANYLILEDDAVFKEGFVSFWNEVFSENLPSDYSLIYLGGCQPWNKPHYNKVLERYNDYFYTIKVNDYFTKNDRFWHMNASSYILHKSGAQKLCEYIDKFGMDDALDNFMQKFFNMQGDQSNKNLIFHLNPLMSYQLHEENDNVEVDKNSDLRYADEKFEGDKKNILYWRSDKGFGNFGDELNVPVGKFLFGDNITFNKKNIPGSIRLIGSNLGDVENEDLACGVGIHHHSQKIKSTLADYRCVRGPLSLKYLQSRGVSIKNIFLGDPALLLKAFYEPIINKELKDKIGVVPHISNIDYFKHQVDQLDGFYLINPTNNWEQVVSEIYSCKSVISSSLHGLICADAYDKPNVWIKVPGKSIPPCDKNTDNGDFKYWDYFMSQGRQIKFINSIHDNLGGKLYEDGNNINLNKLKNSILEKNIEEVNFPNLINISSKQIPKKIHLSWKNKNVLDSNYSLIKKGAKNLELLNPDWDIKVNDDEDVNRYIRDNISKSNWELIKNRKITEKTDLWRLLKIYKEGGLYVDIDRYIDTPLSEVMKSNTSCVIPTFQDVDFSQDFVLSCVNNPMIERAISNNLFNRKNGQNLFYTAVCSYMHAASEFLSGQKVERGDNPVYFNDIRKQIEACEYLETFREIGPEYHTLYRNTNGDFDAQTFEKDKADFYNGESVIHWNSNTQEKHTQLKNTNKRKLVFLQHNLFEEGFISELFEGIECEKVFDIEMESPQQDSVIVYSDIYAKNVNVYPEKHREFLRERFERIKQYFQKCKNCTLIHLSDEHCHANIDHYKNFKHVFRQYYRSNAVADNVTFIPLGYKKGFYDE